MTFSIQPELTDAFIDQVLADIERLSSRTYSEVGVPMFLIAEDVSRGAEPVPEVTSSPRGALMAGAFSQIIAALKARKAELDAGDIAQAIELLADRYFLSYAAPAFSEIAELHPGGAAE